MPSSASEDVPRRQFLVSAGASGLLLGACSKPAAAHEEVSPGEDLMREHGVLQRLLLVYESALDGPGTRDITIFGKTAELVRRFVEDYHEKTEEELVFPRFEAKGRLVPLVTTLRKQHQGGRVLTEEIRRLASPGNEAEVLVGDRLYALVTAFAAMYRPHAAREDTLLFPALHEILTEKEYAELGERFEAREHQLFGEHGFEDILAQVQELEASAGCADLNRFTPA